MKTNLYNVSSGITLPTEIDDKILSVIDNDKSAYDQFATVRLQVTGSVGSHETK